MLLNQVEMRRFIRSLQNIPLFTFKNSWFAFSVCFGSFPLVLWSAVQSNFAALDWIWAESISLYTSELIRLLLSSVHIITKTPVTQSHWKPRSCITPLRVSQMMLFGSSWAVPRLLQTFFFPSFWYRLILISVIQRILFQEVLWLT